MTVSEAVAERIIDLCDERNITINKLCTISAVTQSTVNDIINKRSKNPGVATVKKLCDGLSISVSEFFDSDIFGHLD